MNKPTEYPDEKVLCAMAVNLLSNFGIVAQEKKADRWILQRKRKQPQPGTTLANFLTDVETGFVNDDFIKQTARQRLVLTTREFLCFAEGLLWANGLDLTISQGTTLGGDICQN